VGELVVTFLIIDSRNGKTAEFRHVRYARMGITVARQE